MNAELKENAGLPAHILWTLAIVAGISVANLYYNQPLLNLMRAVFGRLGLSGRSDSHDYANRICARSALHRTARAICTAGKRLYWSISSCLSLPC